ncbi:signal peptide peptidase SppA [Halobacteriales archaeon SW_12_71_31]|nr:MAG: signal peptide peptidase SppA [Halobacteriales archaeon SW_12_71_31]
MAETNGLARGLAGLAVVALVGAVAAAAGTALFVFAPGAVGGDRLAVLLGIVLAVAVALAGVRLGSSLANSLLSSYNVGEVAVEGPITRDGGGGPLPSAPRGAGADETVEQIERADADGQVEALMLRLNTPGGEVLPSEDIRLAAERFDGPTVAYATDTCASGGYWIASGCDELWSREASVVGSIGVVGSRVNAKGLADRVGLSYEQLTAGEYKDAGVPLKEFSDDDREYLQGRIDDFYQLFVERVTEGREMDAATVRETEARVYVGREAHAEGLVDELGTREDVEAALASRIGADDARVREFEPARGLGTRLRGGAATVAYALGAGVADTLGGDGVEFEVRR